MTEHREKYSKLIKRAEEAEEHIDVGARIYDEVIGELHNKVKRLEDALKEIINVNIDDEGSPESALNSVIYYAKQALKQDISK